MGITVNKDLLDEGTPEGNLPVGVFLASEYPEGMALPLGWTELFRVNDKVYGIKTKVNPGVAFRLMRSIRKEGSLEVAMTDMLYDVLGDDVMEVLATEDLDEKEFDAVMKAVNKHVMAVMNRTLGK
jgi:hypothetical protein